MPRHFPCSILAPCSLLTPVSPSPRSALWARPLSRTFPACPSSLSISMCVVRHLLSLTAPCRRNPTPAPPHSHLPPCPLTVHRLHRRRGARCGQGPGCAVPAGATHAGAGGSLCCRPRLAPARRWVGGWVGGANGRQGWVAEGRAPRGGCLRPAMARLPACTAVHRHLLACLHCSI